MRLGIRSGVGSGVLSRRLCIVGTLWVLFLGLV